MENHGKNDYQFDTWWLLHQAQHAIFRVRNKELSQYNLTAEQASVLFVIKVLSETDRKTAPGEIARCVLREPHAVSKILTRMEKDGLVNKVNGLGRKRNEVLVNLTEKGRMAYNYSIKRDTIHTIMSSLTEEECLQLCSLLNKLRDKALHELTKQKRWFSHNEQQLLILRSNGFSCVCAPLLTEHGIHPKVGRGLFFTGSLDIARILRS